MKTPLLFVQKPKSGRFSFSHAGPKENPLCRKPVLSEGFWSESDGVENLPFLRVKSLTSDFFQ
jgi:hypothetical protein